MSQPCFLRRFSVQRHSFLILLPLPSSTPFVQQILHFVERKGFPRFLQVTARLSAFLFLPPLPEFLCDEALWVETEFTVKSEMPGLSQRHFHQAGPRDL